MAFRFADGFDHYATADLTGKWTAASGATIGASSPAPNTGAGRLALTGSGYVEFVNTAGAQTGGSVGFRFQAASLVAGNPILTVFDGATMHVSIYMDGSGHLLAYRGDSGGTLLATSTPTLTAATWQHLRVDWLIDDTAGQVLVYLAGALIITLTGVDTRNGGNASYTAFRLRVGASGTHAFDDVTFCDDDTTTDANNTVLYFSTQPTITTKIASAGDGTRAEFTPSTGSDNGAMVDEATPDGDTTYNKSSTVGHRDTYNFAALGLGGGTVHAVHVNNWMKKGTAVGTSTVAALAYIGGVDYSGASASPLDSYADMRQAWPESPVGGAWAEAVIDAAEFGVTIKS